VAALGAVVSNIDEIDNVVPLLEQLGRDHRRFSVHYTAVGASLLATLQHFLGRLWMPDLADTWTQAYGLVAKVRLLPLSSAKRWRRPPGRRT
jgi:hemoglobin-like flavoprotein